MRILSSLFLTVTLYAVCLFTCPNQLQAANISTDMEALLVFKSHITNDPQNVLASNWTKATNVCTWIGVTCGVRHHRVRTIQLRNMSLEGTIPPEIGNLSFLVNFSVSTNQFHGHLPVQLAKLRRLKSLDLGFNVFDGIFPSWIGSFARLQYLNLRSNNIRGAIPVGIFNSSSLQEIQVRNNWLSGPIRMTASMSMPSLWRLDLSVNNLTGHLPPNMSANFPALEFLLLSYNTFSGHVPSSLFLCNRLQILSLSINRFEGGLHEDFGNLTMLQELYLGANNFQGEIPNSIGKLINLEVLHLRRNFIDGKIPSSIGNLTRLRLINLSENNLIGNVPISMGNLVSVEILFLGVNSLDGILPSAIFNISELVVLSLIQNNLSGSHPPSFGLNLEKIYIAENNFDCPIPTSLLNASMLDGIDFSDNMFAGSIPNALGDLRHLETLGLGYNHLSSPSLSTLFSSLANCRNLNALVLSGNPLNSTIPKSIGNFSSSLESFFFSNNALTGTIPSDVGNLSSLIRFQLGGNFLRGSIPVTISKLSKLQGINFHSNKLQGSIPSELCVLKTLVTMSFGKNHLSGNVPSCFGNLTSLRNIYLQSNRLSSSIPSTLWKLKDILALSLSSNSLSGSLPYDIGNLKAVTLLDLAENQLSGNIPPTFGSMLSLAELYLSNNRFQGSIPESFGEAISLEFVDLSVNNLSGEIPKSLEKLIYLEYFNVSINDLHGEIPNEGPFQNMPPQSFIGNQGLCGAPKFDVHPCKSNNTNDSRKQKIALAVAGTTILGLATIIGILIWCYKRKSRLTRTRQEQLLPLAKLQRISIHELTQATNNFDEVNLLGKGSFGSVYKGTLRNGMSVAVKVYNLESEGAFKSFEVECEFLRNIRHRNLVKVISSCCTSEFKALIMDFMPNWSLDKWLYSHNYFLNISQRLNIMIDVASAIEYLHHGSTQVVVHCDLKPNNILLDDDMVAHITDFGISKLIGQDQSFKQTVTLATVGYMAPEYGSEGLVSVKGDIYSLGIILMETFTRKKPTDEMFNEEMNMKQWVNDLSAPGVTQVADPNLVRVNERHYMAKEDCIASIMELALKCCADLPEGRIDSRDVHNALKKIREKFLKDVQETL